MSHIYGTKHGILGLILVIAFTSSVSGQDATQVTGGRRLIEAERKTIFFAMHPTATLIRADYDGVGRLKDGFVLTYTFHFRGIGGNYYSKMDFVFNDRGRFLGLKTNDTSSLIDPFFASDLAMGLLKDMVKEDFELNKDAIMAKALDAADSRLVLELMLTYKQSKLQVSGPEIRDEELIKLIRSSESMDDAERKEWIDRLPRMNTEQRSELRKILINERDQLAEIDRKYKKSMDAITKQQQKTEAGYNLLMKQDYKASISILSEVVETEPKNIDALFYRGHAWQGLKEHKSAIMDFSKTIELAPLNHGAYRKRAYSHNAVGNYRSAFLDYSRSVELAPKNVNACNGIAWFLATCPEAKYRDGREAVEYATKACELTQWKDPVYFDTLAAACAENNQFEKAVEWQQKALADPTLLEKAVGREELEQARYRLQLFMDKKPFRQVN